MKIVLSIIAFLATILSVVGMIMSAYSIRLAIIVPVILGILKLFGAIQIFWFSFGWSVFTAPIIMLVGGIIGLILSFIATAISATILNETL
jgi:hypothetical protein